MIVHRLLSSALASMNDPFGSSSPLKNSSEWDLFAGDSDEEISLDEASDVAAYPMITHDHSRHSPSSSRSSTLDPTHDSIDPFIKLEEDSCDRALQRSSSPGISLEEIKDEPMPSQPFLLAEFDQLAHLPYEIVPRSRHLIPSHVNISAWVQAHLQTMLDNVSLSLELDMPVILHLRNRQNNSNWIRREFIPGAQTHSFRIRGFCLLEMT